MGITYVHVTRFIFIYLNMDKKEEEEAAKTNYIMGQRE